MQKIHCHKCGSEILRKSVLGIGNFDNRIGKYRGKSFIAFTCPTCNEVRYQFLEDNPADNEDFIINESSELERKKVFNRSKIDINEVISFHKILKDIESVKDLFDFYKNKFIRKNY
ncbi:MAG: hypothetical protein ACOCP8_07250 [archaeon]